MRQLHHIGQFVESFLRNFLVVNDNRVIQISAFYQIVLQEHFNFSDEDKGT